VLKRRTLVCIEVCQVPRCLAVQATVHYDAEFVLNSFRHVDPMKLNTVNAACAIPASFLAVVRKRTCLVVRFCSTREVTCVTVSVRHSTRFFANLLAYHFVLDDDDDNDDVAMHADNEHSDRESEHRRHACFALLGFSGRRQHQRLGARQLQRSATMSHLADEKAALEHDGFVDLRHSPDDAEPLSCRHLSDPIQERKTDN